MKIGYLVANSDQFEEKFMSSQTYDLLYTIFFFLSNPWPSCRVSFVFPVSSNLLCNSVTKNLQTEKRKSTYINQFLEGRIYNIMFKNVESQVFNLILFS